MISKWDFPDLMSALERRRVNPLGGVGPVPRWSLAWSAHSANSLRDESSRRTSFHSYRGKLSAGSVIVQAAKSNGGKLSTAIYGTDLVYTCKDASVGDRVPMPAWFP